MCGRFTILYSWKDLHRLMRLARWPEPEVQTSFNLAPTQQAPVIRLAPDGEREAAVMRWGLVPFWAMDPAIGNRMINARSETAPEKPAFRAAFRQRRCLIPVSGFYEWQTLEDQRYKQPWYITPADGELLAFAGLWESWDKGGGILETFTILTTQANDDMRPVHDRMPVIAPQKSWGRWLDPSERSETFLRSVLTPAPQGALRLTRVSTHVNRPANNDPRCIEPEQPPE